MAYKSDDRLSRSARKFYNAYKKMFDSFSEQNRHNAAAETVTGVNSEKMQVTDGERRWAADKSFSEQIDDVVQGTHNPRYDLFVSETPEALIEVKFPQGPLLMRNGKINEILDKHKEMSEDLLKKIPDAVADPILILKSKTHPTESVVLITDIVTSKGEMIVPVWVNQEGNYLDIELGDIVLNTNFVASAYGRNIKALIEYAVNDNGVFYQNPDEKRVKNLLARNGLQLSTPLKISDSTIIIPENEQNVNTSDENNERHSLPEMIDSEGFLLSDGQRDFFRESKITDENGDLIRVQPTKKNGAYWLAESDKVGRKLYYADAQNLVEVGNLANRVVTVKDGQKKTNHNVRKMAKSIGCKTSEIAKIIIAHKCNTVQDVVYQNEFIELCKKYGKDGIVAQKGRNTISDFATTVYAVFDKKQLRDVNNKNPIKQKKASQNAQNNLTQTPIKMYNKKGGLWSLLSKNEIAQLHSRNADKSWLSYNEKQLPNGNYLIDIENKLIETNGDPEYPTIDSIVEFNTLSSKITKARIYFSEAINNGRSIREGVGHINGICKETVAKLYLPADFRYNRGFQGQGQGYGQNRGNTGNGRNGRGSSSANKTASLNTQNAQTKTLNVSDIIHKNFLPENEILSEAHRLAVWWARRSNVVAGAQTIIYVDGIPYLVEKFDDALNYYQVEKQLTDVEAEEIYKEIYAYDGDIQEESIQSGIDEINKSYQSSDSFNKGKPSADSDNSGHRREDNQIQGLGAVQTQTEQPAGYYGDGNNERGNGVYSAGERDTGGIKDGKRHALPEGVDSDNVEPVGKDGKFGPFEPPFTGTISSVTTEKKDVYKRSVKEAAMDISPSFWVRNWVPI